MSLKNDINDHIKDAMRAKDKLRMETLRSIKAALLEKEISKRTGGEAELTADEDMQVLKTLAKKRKDAMEQYQSANRPELAAKESSELDIINQYLPQPMSEADITAMLKSVIDETGAASMKDIGKVMPVFMKQSEGRADGKLVQHLLRGLLEG